MDSAIWIGSDHAGYDLKAQIIAYLEEKELPYHDVGTNSATELVRYPRFGAQVASAVSTGRAARGILVCGTGLGMSILANKFKGVRASMCTSTFMAKMTRAHNNSNILCLGGKLTGVWEAIDIVEAWIATDFDGGRHSLNLALVAEAEEILNSPNDCVLSEERSE